MRNMEKRKVVVTGGGGFVGSHLVKMLLERGDEVHVIDTFVLGKEAEYLNAGATYHEVDVRDAEKILPIVDGATVIFHAAALPSVQYSIEFPRESHSVNTDGTLSVLEAVRKTGANARVVLMSSASCYGDQDMLPLVETMEARPKSPYALQKYMSEIALQGWSEIYGVQSVALRCFNIYGPRMRGTGAYASAIGTFLRQKKEGKPLTIVGDGTQTRDYVHVRDVARANILAAESKKVGKAEVVNIGTGVETSVNDIAALIGGETVNLPPRLEPRASVAGISKAKELLTWEPTISFAEGIEELKNLYK